MVSGGVFDGGNKRFKERKRRKFRGCCVWWLWRFVEYEEEGGCSFKVTEEEEFGDLMCRRRGKKFLFLFVLFFFCREGEIEEYEKPCPPFPLFLIYLLFFLP